MYGLLSAECKYYALSLFSSASFTCALLNARWSLYDSCRKFPASSLLWSLMPPLDAKPKVRLKYMLKNYHFAKCVGPVGHLYGAESLRSSFWNHGLKYLRVPFWHYSWTSWYWKVKMLSSLKTSGTINSATQRNNPEDPTQHQHCEKLKSRSPKVHFWNEPYSRLYPRPAASSPAVWFFQD